MQKQIIWASIWSTCLLVEIQTNVFPILSFICPLHIHMSGHERTRVSLSIKLKVFKQDTVVLWSKSSTLDRKFEGSNPAAINSF